MVGKHKAASVPTVPFTQARRWHLSSLATLTVSVLINVIWIVAFIWLVCIGFDVWLEHTEKLPRILWRGTRL